MAMSDRLAAAFNDQITLEFASSYTYLQLAAFFEERSLTGFSSWMRAQSEEEWVHALKFYDFVLDRGNEVTLGPIAAPQAAPESPLAAFESALEHERHVTSSITALYELAQAESDSSSLALLQWFLSEQVEEEASVGEVCDQLRFAAENPAAVLMLDREMAGRQSTETG